MYEEFLNRVTRGGKVKTYGADKLSESDMIMEETWNDDPQSRVGYLYGYGHDDDPLTFRDRHPETDTNKVPVDIKFIIVNYPSISKDQPEYHIQFRPSFNSSAIDYYKKEMCNGSEFPIGLYIDIPDDYGKYQRWLIVAREDANQFRKYSVLKCNYLLHYVSKNRLVDVCCVARLRNSYNSGEWTNDKTTVVQNQNMVWLPECDPFDNLYYNQRFIIDARTANIGKKYDSYLSWHISKIENTFPVGINKITLNQEFFDPSKDGCDPTTGYMYADYYQYANAKSDTDSDHKLTSKIAYNGQPTIKVASGSYKTFKLVFYGQDGKVTDVAPVSSNINDYWRYTVTNADGTKFDDDSVKDIVTTIGDSVYSVKFKIDNPLLLGKIVHLVGHNADGSAESNIDVKVVSL